MKTENEVLSEVIREINPEWDYGDTDQKVFATLHFAFDPEPARNIILKAMKRFAEQFKYLQVCPKCNGQGIVSRPPYIPGDITNWSSGQTSFECNLCNGKKFILL